MSHPIQQLVKLLTANIKAKRGNVAMMFVLVAGAMASVFAGGIELGRVNDARARLQAAADATALAAKRTEMDNRRSSEAVRRGLGVAAGQDTIAAHAAQVSESITDMGGTITWETDGAAKARLTAKMQTVFGGLLGVNKIDISATGIATAGEQQVVEVAILLDNTASMFEKDGRASTRFSIMRGAAKRFVNTMYDEIETETLRMGVVPFTTTVNILGETPLGWDDAAAPLRSPEDFGTRSLPTNPMNRRTNVVENQGQLTQMFAPVGWRGCISGNGESQITSDDPRAGMQWNALLVPPELRNTTRTQNKRVTTTCQSCTGCNSGGGGGGGGGGGTTLPPGSGTQGNLSPLPGVPRNGFASFTGDATSNAACSCVTVSCQRWQCPAGQANKTGIDCAQDDHDGTRNAFFNANNNQVCLWGGCQGNLNTSTEGACASDPNEIAWNNANGRWCPWVARTDWKRFEPITGPNLNCPMPLLGLSGNRNQIINTIDRLSPAPGGTHNDVGLRWGLRMLSPRQEWASFFGHATPDPFNGESSSKVMILITDGANQQAVDFPGYWGCSQAGAPGCTGSPNRAALDQRMLAWCTAIREEYGVALYTVAVNVTDGTAVDLLRRCAGSDERAFSGDATALDATFAEIARQTFRLRLRQ